MKKIWLILIALVYIFVFTNCEEESDPDQDKVFSDVQLEVNFGSTSKLANATKDDTPLTYETPEDYYIAVKSVTLIGSGETEDYTIFDNGTLALSEVYEFTDNDNPISLLQGEDIPEGNYSSVKLEIYYLQMNIAISLSQPGDREPIERRNFRIYMSDDEDHQPGDMTQINEGVEIGWLLGEAQYPNMDPVTPRTAAYTENGDGVSWYDFAGKSAQYYGPFGDVTFWASAPQPIYYIITDFSFESTAGQTMIIEFDVADCWKFQDKDGNGTFGYGDLDPQDPTEWQMDFPSVSVQFE